MKLQLKRSNVLVSGGAKEPTAAQLDYGELAINYSAGDAAIFLKDSTNNVIRIAGVHNIADDGLTNVPTTTSPPTTPTPEAGNLWYNSEDGRLYIYYVDDNSSQWVDASPDTWQTTVIPNTTNPAHQAGTLDDRYVNINGDTLTGALLLDNAAAEATPDLAFDGDLNTGIYSPGADSLAITTAGTQRVTVDSSGRLGVGVSTMAGGSSSVSILRNNELSWADTDGTRRADIYGDSSSNLVFRNGTGSTERMRIDSTGKVGIGTTSPGVYGVHANNSSNSVYFRADSGSVATYYGSVDAYSTGLFGTFTNHALAAYTNSTERMRIDSSGNVGIGNTNPSQLLHLTSTGSNTFLQFSDSGSGGSAAQARIGSNGNDLVVLNNTGSNTATERMRISSSGNVGIGTSSPRGKLEVSDGTSNTAGEAINEAYIVGATTGSSEGILTIQSNNGMASNKGGSIAFGGRAVTGSSAGANWAFINGYKENGTTANYGGYLSFATRPNSGAISEAMRIDSSGKLLVGTTSSFHMGRPGAIQVAGGTGAGPNNAFINATRFGTVSGGGELTLGASYGSNGNHGLVPNGHQLGQISFVGSDGTNGRYASLIRSEVDGTSGTNVMPGRLVFQTTSSSSGANPTERMRISSVGGVSIGTSNTDGLLNISQPTSTLLNSLTTSTATSSSFTGACAIEVNTHGYYSANKAHVGIKFINADSNAGRSNREIDFRNYAGSLIGGVTTTTTATSFNTSSDYRLKEKVALLTGAVDRVNQLQVHRFNFIADPDKTVDGFIAHEAQTVVPECVTGTKDEIDDEGNPVYQGIDQSKLVPLLTAALQEAIGEIETLKQRLSDAGIA